jgi:hypothetical protein
MRVINITTGARGNFDRRLSVGSAPDNDFVILTDTRVSQHHALIEFESTNVFRITDLNSTNGTFVNGLRISKATRIRASDLIHLGKSDLVLNNAHRPTLIWYLSALPIFFCLAFLVVWRVGVSTTKSPVATESPLVTSKTFHVKPHPKPTWADHEPHDVTSMAYILCETRIGDESRGDWASYNFSSEGESILALATPAAGEEGRRLSRRSVDSDGPNLPYFSYSGPINDSYGSASVEFVEWLTGLKEFTDQNYASYSLALGSFFREPRSEPFREQALLQGGNESDEADQPHEGATLSSPWCKWSPLRSSR